MNDPKVVRRDEGLGDLTRDAEERQQGLGLGLGSGACGREPRLLEPGDQLRQRSAADQLHDDGANRLPDSSMP